MANFESFLQAIKLSAKLLLKSDLTSLFLTALCLHILDYYLYFSQVGVFHLLDDESNFPKASDLSFLEKCHYNHALNELYSR